MEKKYTIIMILFCMNYEIVTASSDNLDNHQETQEQFNGIKQVAKFRGRWDRIGALKRTKELEKSNQEKYDVLPRDEEDTVLDSCSILIPDTRKLAEQFQGLSPEVTGSESFGRWVQSSSILEALTKSFDDEKSSNELTPHSESAVDRQPKCNSATSCFVDSYADKKYDEAVVLVDLDDENHNEQMVSIDFNALSGQKK